MISYKGSATIRPWFNLLRGGGTFLELVPSGDPSVVCRSGDVLKMSIRGKFRNPGSTVMWTSERLQAGLEINGDNYPLGVYIITTISESHEVSGDYINLQGYSVLYLLSRQKLEERLFYAAGTKYLTAIQEIIGMGTITDIEADACDSVLATDREWESGEALLEIVNELLSEINFREVYPDMYGVVQLREYKAPESGNITATYTSGEYSVLFEEYTLDQDGFDRPNVFRFLCTNPERDEELVAEAVNDDPKNPFSTVNLGARVIEVTKVDNVADLPTLQTMAENRMQEAQRSTQSVRFTTAIQPEHGVYDVVALDHGDASGIYEETEWTIQMGSAGKMTHKAERVIVV